ncbi:rhodanese-like domain-containing protein [Chelatococcus asaccharovorans]|uniref:rhodanese-like domain-containing protein n=1 Tax=Chelatococcus asaccharovorans TaxID=28210 RepID=UPI00224C70CD|nr:rhodanese-like domain-containing protein [Chelatococcus asaccharovorans]CAH1665303.1 Rhodanese-related sulfurtransferase [Chelatococcus asaccharovorans]CAH1682018.1 Rhodanese-related sulfurtransferase [Chelatococcus asaccharovorans]
MRGRRFGTFFQIAVIAAALSAGEAVAHEINIYQSKIGETDQKTEEISTEQMRQILSDGSATVLDTRPHAEFVNGHIPGAKYLEGPPSAAVAGVERLVGGDKSKALVLYCNGPFCQASRRLSGQLRDSGFTNVRRYQLGMPIWRALGGPTVIELDGVIRIHKNDHTAVFLDARSAEEFAKRSLPRAQNLPPETAATVQGGPMPLDDFNTRIVVFGRDDAQARALADALSKRPWHNVAYFPGSFETLLAAVTQN